MTSGPSAVSPPAKDSDAERHDDGEASQLWECVCYGLGSFSSSVSSRYQLAMLLLLLDTIQVSGYVDNERDFTLYDVTVVFHLPSIDSSEGLFYL